MMIALWLLLLAALCMMVVGKFTLWQEGFEGMRLARIRRASRLVHAAPLTKTSLVPILVPSKSMKSGHPEDITPSGVRHQNTQLLSALTPSDEQSVKTQQHTSPWQGAICATTLHPGYEREDNQDCLFAISLLASTPQGLEGRGVYIVADGIGGQAGGKEASTRAIRVVVETLLASVTSLSFIDDDRARLLLRESVQCSNRLLCEINGQRKADESMGTTITLAVVLGQRLFVANVGDSRTYLFQWRSGLFRQITVDHSHVQLLVERGAIARDDMYTHPDRNLIYRSVGDRPQIEVDVFEEQMECGDKLLLCSDGLWEMVHDRTLKQIMQQPLPPEITASTLLHAALTGGGMDNVSAIVVKTGLW